MFRNDVHINKGWDVGPAFGSSSFGYSPGSGEFGADPGALSQTTREQWEMVAGHREWEPKAPMLDLDQIVGWAGRRHGRPKRRENPQKLLAGEGIGSDYEISDTAADTGGSVYLGIVYGDDGFFYKQYADISGFIYEVRVQLELSEEIIVVDRREDPTATSALTTLPTAAPWSDIPSSFLVPPPSQEFRSSGVANSTRSAGPGDRLGGAPRGSVSEWLYRDSLGILYSGESGDAIKQSLPVDTGSIPGNYAINTWLSLGNVVAGYLSAGVVISNKVDDFFNRHLGYGAIQTTLPMSKAMGIAVEAGPAIEYLAVRLSTGWSSFSTNPRVVSAALAPIFPTLAAGGTRSSAVEANFEHLLRGGSSDRGIAVLSVDTSKLTPSDIGSTVEAIKDMDFQAGIAGGLVRTAVPSRSVANSVAALGKMELSLGPTEAAGHLPDVAGGGSPLGPIMGMSRSVNSSIGGQWRRYAPGFTFDGYSLIDQATGEFLYISHALEHAPTPIP